MGSMLLAREVPPYGGDTMFANQYLAYEALSDGLKQTLDGLIGVSSSIKADVTKTREDRMKAAGAEHKVLTAEHPIVRTHPETGRKALYTSGPTPRTSRAGRRRRACRCWSSCGSTRRGRNSPVASAGTWARSRSGTIAAPCTIPINDYHGHRRVMHRITLAGDKPR